MKLYSENENYKLYQGNMLDMLEVIEPNSVDSIVTDPPYELGFMNKDWDNSGIAFKPDTWKKCYEVLKSGGYLLAFGGSRTFYRIACAIEDAGFEIRDTIMWLYGSGFPKSHNIGLDIDKLNGCPDRGHRIAVANRHHPDGTLEPNGEQLKPYETKTEEAHKWNGWGTALKPSFEPIIVARKPIEGTVARNCLKYGVGGINIDECRIGNEKIKWKPRSESVSYAKTTYTDRTGEINIGRFPANTILTYDENDYDEVCSGFPDTKGGIRHNMCERKSDLTSYGFQNNTRNEFSDSGSASRYFYCAKASKKDRDEGLDKFPIVTERNIHPTVKPTLLMQYLIRLVTPNNGIILDPFNGSGSTGKAVMYENNERNKNYKYIGIELTEEYLPISKARIEYAKSISEKSSQPTIFDYILEDGSTKKYG